MTKGRNAFEVMFNTQRELSNLNDAKVFKFKYKLCDTRKEDVPSVIQQQFRENVANFNRKLRSCDLTKKCHRMTCKVVF